MWKFRSWRSKRILNHQNLSYPRGVNICSKFAPKKSQVLKEPTTARVHYSGAPKVLSTISVFKRFANPSHKLAFAHKFLDIQKLFGRPIIFGRPNIFGRPKVFGHPKTFGRPNIFGRPKICGRPKIFCTSKNVWTSKTFWTSKSFWASKTFWTSKNFWMQEKRSARGSHLIFTHSLVQSIIHSSIH